MTRKWFLGLIGLGAAGQTAIVPKDRLSTEPPPGNLLERNSIGFPYHTVKHQPYKPKNGECPVCGTMAGARRQESARVIATNPPIYIEATPYSMVVRCAHCNAAFWQDAEDGK